MSKIEIKDADGKPAKQINQWPLTVWAIALSAVALFIAIMALFVANLTADKLPASGQSCIRANYQGQLYIGVCQ